MSGPTISDRIAARVRETPDKIALVDDELRLTYRELDQVTDRLADRFAAAGAAPERVVAVLVRRKIEAAIALVAVLKTGGVYLPLESAAPRERIEFALENSSAAVLFAGSGTGDAGFGLPTVTWPLPPRAASDEVPAAAPDRVVAAAAACVVYTSGTTGRPKGVCLEQHLLLEHLDAISAGFGLRRDDRILQFSPVHADTAIEQVLTSLVLGATLVVTGETMTVSAFLEFLGRHRVTVAHIATGYWNVIATTLEWRPWPDLPLRTMIVGGDRMLANPLLLWQKYASLPLLNAYGPTETMITPNVHRVREFDRELGAPIGGTIGDRVLYVLDEHLRPCPAGTAGELYLGGRMLARGFVGHPGMTARAFVPDPFCGIPGRRMYRTGDIVRRARDGQLYFIGRSDSQIKHRGFRVELGEIDAALVTHPGVREGVVVAREDRPGDQRLVAYVVRGAGDVGARTLRSYLAGKLPDHMVPAAYVFLPALPLTTNSKIDRKVLRTEPYRPDRMEGKVQA